MLTDNSGINMQEQLLDTCRIITREKIALITKALAANGKIKRKKVDGLGFNYDMLADSLAKLIAAMRSITPDDFNPVKWREAINQADFMWWEWYDNYPLAKEIPDTDVNYTPYVTEQEALRETLRSRYAAPELVPVPR